MGVQLDEYGFSCLKGEYGFLCWLQRYSAKMAGVSVEKRDFENGKDYVNKSRGIPG